MTGRSALSFSKAKRLRKRREYLPIQEGGSRIALRSCILLLAARPDDGPTRLGITVTRKYGNAVRRNRAKRLIREVFRQSTDLFCIGIDVVVIPKGSAELSTLRLREEWAGAARLIAARSDSLRRALAKKAEPSQTPGPKVPTA